MIGILQKKNELLCELLTYWQSSTHTLKSKFPVDVDIRWKEFFQFCLLHCTFLLSIDRPTAVELFFFFFHLILDYSHNSRHIKTYITLFIPSNSISAFLLRCDIKKKKTWWNDTRENKWYDWQSRNGHIQLNLLKFIQRTLPSHFMSHNNRIYSVFFFVRHIVTLQKCTNTTKVHF